MNVTALSNSSLVSSLSALSSKSSSASSSASGSSTQASVTQLSPLADMMAKLSALKSSDPAAFQATMKDMADGLRTLAKDKGGELGKALNGLADKVTQAADSGDLSVLTQPPANASGASGAAGRPPRGGPPPGGGGSPAGESSSSTKKSSNADPADTNGDGTVSAAEKLLYALSHPNAQAQSSTSASLSSASQ